MGEGVLDQPVPGTYYNGLLGVSIIPYIAKAQDDPDAIRDVLVTDSQTDSSTAPSTICKASVLALRSEV